MSSPVDPAYDPVTRSLQPIGAGTESGPVAGPDEPRSFLDLNSDDSSDDGVEPVLHRASSVRVGKPHIVEHSNASGGSVPKLYPLAHEKSKNPENSAEPPPLPTLEPQQQPDVPGGREEALMALEGRAPSADDTAIETSETSAQAKDTMKETILEYPHTAGTSALDTLPTPFGGFGSVRVRREPTDSPHSSSTFVSPPSLDGLRANPITETDKKLSRAISAPVRNPSRRVTIRPADLVINYATNDHKLFRDSIVGTPYPARTSSMDKGPQGVAPDRASDWSLRRARPLSQHDEGEEEAEKGAENSNNAQPRDEKSDKTHAPDVPLSTKPSPSAPATSKSDRFPSPVAPEILFLELQLDRHPAARVTVEIEVVDKATYDDEKLFIAIRKAYHQKLLGVARRFFSARTISHASGLDIPPSSVGPHTARSWDVYPSMSLEIDGRDFIRHLSFPRCGRRRKTWLLWLRNRQIHEPPDTLARRSRMAYSPQTPPSPAFSFAHSRNNSSGGNDVSSSPVGASTPSPVSVGGGNGGGSTGSGGVILSAKPSITIPRMPFQPSSLRAKALATTPHQAQHGHSQSHAYYQPPLPSRNGPPRLRLHHTFSLPKILGVVALTLLLSVFTTIMWIIFGLPGRGADQGDGTTIVEGKEYRLSWQRDAQGRVLVGLVLGLAVMALGVVSEAVWVWASWVLL